MQLSGYERQAAGPGSTRRSRRSPIPRGARSSPGSPTGRRRSTELAEPFAMSQPGDLQAPQGARARRAGLAAGVTRSGGRAGSRPPAARGGDRVARALPAVLGGPLPALDELLEELKQPEAARARNEHEADRRGARAGRGDGMKNAGHAEGHDAPRISEIAMSRVFDAPRRLVFDAYTKPELLKRWLFGPDGWSLAVCEVDLRVGGRYRYVWRRLETGTEMGMGGVFRELVAARAPGRHREVRRGVVSGRSGEHAWSLTEAGRPDDADADDDATGRRKPATRPCRPAWRTAWPPDYDRLEGVLRRWRKQGAEPAMDKREALAWLERAAAPAAPAKGWRATASSRHARSGCRWRSCCALAKRIGQGPRARRGALGERVVRGAPARGHGRRSEAGHAPADGRLGAPSSTTGAICDTVCWHLFDYTPFAWEKARQWSRSPREFVKRGGLRA